MKKSEIIAPVKVTQEQIKNMLYLTSLPEDNYDVLDPYQVAEIVQTFIEMCIEVHL